jgi:hypothetical protein
VGCRDGQHGTVEERRKVPDHPIVSDRQVVPMRKYEMETSELVQIRVVGWLLVLAMPTHHSSHNVSRA